MKEYVEPEAGQWWQSTDPRDVGHPFEIVAVHAEHVEIRPQGRRTTRRIKRSRLRPGSTGYRLMHPQEVRYPR